MFDEPMEIVQMAWIVSDLDEAMAKWMKSGRVGPFFVMRNVAKNAPVEVKMHGKVIEADASFALANAGSVQIELIQRLGTTIGVPDTAVTLPMDHVAIWTDDIQATLDDYAAKGFEIKIEGVFGPARTRFAYVDTRHSIGCQIEVLERTTPHLALFDRVASAARGWDGNNPIRQI
jgi:catechol 2,3-dioxygenase-like lactoylglutathione lyase family enzyme